jgi:FG-GAP repeat/Bacterial Ig-like domain
VALPFAVALLACLLASAMSAATASADAPSASPPNLMALMAVQQGQLTASDGAYGDNFGYSVAISGDTALVGATHDAVGGNANQGSAYVFTRSGGSWSQQAQLTASDGAAGDWFGNSVAISGDTALVGAHNDTVGGKASQGSAYVFTRSGASWSQQAQLTASDGAVGDCFGSSVALSGDTALVGVPYSSDKGSQGSAYVFTRSGASWSQQAQLTASDGAAGDWFGYSVAISGDTALVGAPFDSVGANYRQGSASVFTRSGGSWSQQAQLTASDGAVDVWFGYSVAISGDTALVGAYWDTVGGNAYQGSAYVFTRSGASWSQQAQLTASDGAYGDNFGYSVAISGDTALVGVHNDTVGGNANQGSAYVFTRSGGSWSQQTQLTASDGAANDWFGYSVALSGDTALVGAYTDTVGGNPLQGSAYVFSPGSVDTTAPTTTASGVPAGWSTVPVSLTFSATDNPGGSGMTGGLAKTEYQLDSSAWTRGTSCTVSGDGVHTVSYRSTDAAGNVETAKSATLKIDTGKPTSTATKNVTAKKGKKAKLSFKVSDPAPSCGTASVTVTIKLKKKTVKTIKIANVTANKARSYTFKVTLKKGGYTWTVRATDAAGNVGKVSKAKKLIVK